MKIGDKIPEMLGVDMNGNEVKASDFAGKKLISVRATPCWA